MPNSIHLPMINITPTMRCNLKCKLCGVLVPQYEYRPHMTLEEFDNNLKAIFEVVDHIGKLQITGGEPLIHTDLPDMIENSFKYKAQFDMLWLFTNCAVNASPRLIDTLKKHKDKILIHASDYGVNPGISEKLRSTFEDNSIPYKYLKYYGDEQYYDGWVDQGDFVKKGRTEEEMAEVFSKCSHVKRAGSWYIRCGQMHWCGRSIRGTEVGKIPVRAEDYFDIFTGSIEERKERLLSLMKVSHILACDYCNGEYGTEDKNKRLPAGEQL